METNDIKNEVRVALKASEEMSHKNISVSSTEEDLSKLEIDYSNKPSKDVQLKLLSKYIFLSQWLQLGDSIKIRERFQKLLPEHFKFYMEMRNSDTLFTQSKRWSGCLRCKHNLGQKCAKGTRPSSLPSRYQKVDFHCSSFESKG